MLQGVLARESPISAQVEGRIILVICPWSLFLGLLWSILCYLSMDIILLEGRLVTFANFPKKGGEGTRLGKVTYNKREEEQEENFDQVRPGPGQFYRLKVLRSIVIRY